MIELSNVVFAYPHQPVPILQGLTWHVARGERWALIGPSGCGKSTLLYLIAGLRAPEAGTITVNGERVPRKKPRGSTGLVLQDYGLVPWATLRENVQLGLRIRHFYRQGEGHTERGRVDACSRRTLNAGPGAANRVAILGSGESGESTDSPESCESIDSHAARTIREHASVDFWLKRLGLYAVKDKYPVQVSGGQRQRAAIARTLVLEPDVLLMDEPFAALDALTRRDLEQLTLELHAETCTTLVFVTHNIEEAVLLGDKIMVLGQPPHRAPRFIENACAGGDSRTLPAFQAQCRLLGEALGQHA